MVRLEDLFGEASEIDADELESDFRGFLLEDETVERAFVVVQTMFFFTDKRLIIISREGFTGTKMDYHTVPYRSIRDFSVDTPGRFESEGELRLWLTGMTSPMRFKIDSRMDVDVFHRVISRYALG